MTHSGRPEGSTARSFGMVVSPSAGRKIRKPLPVSWFHRFLSCVASIPLLELCQVHFRFAEFEKANYKTGHRGQSSLDSNKGT